MIFISISLKEKMFFARHMAIMSKSGMHILDILRTLRKQAQSSSMRRILDDLTEHVKNGQFLADGLAKYRRQFGDFFVNVVRIGELSGTLSENLEYLAESVQKKRDLESKVKGAMAYPIIILIATLGLTAGMTFFIFPKILPIFKSLKVELPTATKIFIKISTLMIEHGVVVLGIAVAVIIGLWLILKIRPVRYCWDRLLLAVPILGTMIQHYNVVLFVRTISLLLKSGIKVVQALEICANSMENLAYRAAVLKIAAGVGKGDPITKHLAAHPYLFPAVLVEMIGVGEQTGRLTDTCTYLATYYEAELDTSTKTLSNILEPLMLLVMGFIVGFVALSIILPIYEVSQGIKIK